jgi:SpoVK/Ycf46/Vps4 family AAA+-type ATPase
MAKWTREQAVKERRALKQQKKQAAAAAKRAEADGTAPPAPEVDGEIAEEIAGQDQELAPER